MKKIKLPIFNALKQTTFSHLIILSFGLISFQSIGQYTTQGICTQSGNIFNLATVSQSPYAGRFWKNTKIDLTNDFEINFNLALGSSDNYGLAFVMQRITQPTSTTPATNINLDYIWNYGTGSLPTSFGIGISMRYHFCSVGQNQSYFPISDVPRIDMFKTGGECNTANYYGTYGPLSTGGTVNYFSFQPYKIKYIKSTNTVSAYFNNILIKSAVVDLASLLGGNDAWWGFSSGCYCVPGFPQVQILDPPNITSFTPNNGYTGTSVIITGTNFTGASSVTIGSSTVSSFTVNDDSHITAIVGAGTTGLVSITTPGGTASSSASFIYNGYITAGSGDWSSGITWLGGNIPPDAAEKRIAHGVTISSPVTNAGVLKIASGTLYVGSTYTNTGTTNVSVNFGGGHLFMLDGGSFVNSGSLTYGPNSMLRYQGTITRTTADEFPTTNGPAALSIQNSGGVKLHGPRTITWVLQLNDGLFDNSTNNITLADGTIVSRGHGSISLVPVFSGSIDLEYLNGPTVIVTGPELPTASSVLRKLYINAQDVELSSSINVTQEINLYEPGKLIIGNHNVVAPVVRQNYGPTTYVVTNGTGRLTIQNISSTPVLFPIGPSSTSYIPVTISNGGGADFSARVRPTFTNSPANATKAVNAEWIITKTGAQTGNNVTLTPQWNASDEGNNFIRDNSLVLGHYGISSWDEISSGTVSGTGPYRTTVTGVSSFSSFGVGNTNAFVNVMVPPPTIISFTPESGAVGTSVTITGTNFNATASNNIVYFGAVRATVTSGTTNSLTVILPAGATYQPLSVLDNATGLTGYSSKPFITTFINPFGSGIPANFYKPRVDISTGDASYVAVMSDVDGDGKPDLVIANYAGTISVLRNISTSGSITAASFAEKVDFAVETTPSTIAIGDLDGDGKPDIVVGYRWSQNVSVLRNTSTVGNITSSSFASKVDFTTGDVSISVAIGDLDVDGKPDIVVANLEAISLSVLRNTSIPGSIDASSFAAKIDLPTTYNPSCVAINDLDGDGKPELVATNYGGYNVSLYHNTSTPGVINAGSFAPRIDLGTGPNPFSVAIGDMDGDGKPDLNVVSVGGFSMTLFRNNSTLGSIEASSFDAGVNFDLANQSVDVALGDVDGDGKPDVVSVHQYSGKISVLRNTATPGAINAGSFAPKVEFAPVDQPISVAIGDLDGDGKAEIVSGNFGSNTVSIFQIGNPLTCPADKIVNTDVGQCTAIVNGIEPGSGTDVNYILTGATSGNGVGSASGKTFNKGTTTVTYALTSDPAVSCSFTITVIDNRPPSITCSAPVTLNASPGLCTGTTTLIPPTVTDNCNAGGNALSFAGGYVNVPDAPILNPFNEWTLETWVRRTNTGVQESLIEKYDQPGDRYGYLLRILDNNKAMAGFLFGSFGGYFIEGVTPILPNTWYHLATTVNRTTGVMKLYVNGILDAQVTGMVGLPTLPNTATLKLGARGDDAATRLGNGGLIDEIRLWSVERSQAEIQASMNSELNTQAGLIALYHLDQGIAGGNNAGITSVADESGNANNGTLQEFALTGQSSNWVDGLFPGAEPVLTNNAPSEFPIGITTITWTATDASGNSATCTQVVTVEDNQPPSIICPEAVTIHTTQGLCTGTTTLTPPIVTDNCNALGNALNFNGGYVNVPHSSLITPLNAWTIETWVRRTTTNTQESLIEKYSNAYGVYGYLLRIQGDYAVTSFLISSNFGYTITGTTPLLPNVWYHLAATFNRTSGEIKLYVNGVLDGQLTGLSGLPTDPGTQSLKIGARGDDADTRLSNGGLMDEVRIWNVERTQAEILSSMNYEIGAQPGLVALYHLNQGIAGGNNTGLTNVIDASGNGHNGSLIDFALTGPTSNWVGGKDFGLNLHNNAPDNFPTGNTIVTWTATDASGNSATCTQVVTVVDNQQPVITSPVTGNTNRNTNAGICTYKVVLMEFNATATDNCGVTSLTYQLTGATTGTGTTLADVVFNKGVTTVKWTASDGVTGNVTSSFTVTVVDNEKPVITSCPAVPIQCYSATGTYPVPFLIATDNCGVQSISYNITGATSRSGNSNNASGIFNPGISTIAWKVTDANSNTISCTTTVTIDKVDATIPNVFASNITSAIGAANTIYIGYGGTSVTLSAQVSSSVSPNSYTYKWTAGSPSGTTVGTGSTVTVSPTSTTVYYLSVKDMNTCKPLYQVTKQINVIDIRCGAGKVNVCQFKNGSYSTVCISSTTKNINSLPAGSYLGPCASATIVSAGETYNKEISVAEFSIKTIPNPTTHSFVITIQSPDQKTPISFKVINVSGQIIETRKNVSQGQALRIGGNYIPGIYIAEIIQGTNRKVIKLIKQ